MREPCGFTPRSERLVSEAIIKNIDACVYAQSIFSILGLAIVDIGEGKKQKLIAFAAPAKAKARYEAAGDGRKPLKAGFESAILFHRNNLF